MMKWKIYYDDGHVHASGFDVPTPARGIQAIVQDHPEVGAEIVTASDYYVFDDGRWRGVDIFGLFDFLLDSGIVLFGRTISREEYAEVYKQVARDKNGWLPDEVRVDG